MPVSAAFREYVLEQLEGLEGLDGLTVRAMFGGFGLYSQGLLFAVLDDDVIYLRTDEAGRARFVAAGSRPFAPITGAKPMLGYWEAPADVLEDRAQLAEWSIAARAVARAARVAKDAKLEAKPKAASTKSARKSAAAKPAARSTRRKR